MLKLYDADEEEAEEVRLREARKARRQQRGARIAQIERDAIALNEIMQELALLVNGQQDGIAAIASASETSTALVQETEQNLDYVAASYSRKQRLLAVAAGVIVGSATGGPVGWLVGSKVVVAGAGAIAGAVAGAIAGWPSSYSALNTSTTATATTEDSAE